MALLFERPWINLLGVMRSKLSRSLYLDPRHIGRLFNSLEIQANAVS